MSNDVAVKSRLPMPAGIEGIDSRSWRVLIDSIFPSAKSAEAVVMALDYCRVRKLDPFKRPVNIVPMWNKSLKQEVETVWPGINSIQVDASRTKEWAGMDAPVWGENKTETFEGGGNYKDDDGNWSKDALKVTVTYPESCTMTVYRIVCGQRCAFTETVFWKEAYASIGKTGVPNYMWQKRPQGQLHKCAKAAVLRAAFPEEGDYTSDEMEGKEIMSGGVVIENEKAEARSVFKNASLRNKWFENVNDSFVAAKSVDVLKELAVLNALKFDEMEKNGNKHDLLALEELRKRYSAALSVLKSTPSDIVSGYDEETGELDPNGEFTMPDFLGKERE